MSDATALNKRDHALVDHSNVVGAAESRRDAITGDWTIFAPHRGERPCEFQSHIASNPTATECPFCPGYESATPSPVWVGRHGNNGFQASQTRHGIDQHAVDDWSVRVVPNKYPAVTEPGAAKSSSAAKSSAFESTLFQRSAIEGGHEVIIESPKHAQSLTELDLADVMLTFRAYRDRLRFWRDVPQVRYMSLFKNVGGNAGASLNHSHSQLIATNQVPSHIESTVQRQRRHQAETGCCLSCSLLRGELKVSERIVVQSDELVAYCPFASRLPMLVRLTTKQHESCFEDLADETLDKVAQLTVRVIGWLEQLQTNVAYNVLLHTRPPFIRSESEPYHWSLEVFPRLTQIAGFEWSSRCMINPMLPETAAAKLRKCAQAEDPRRL